MSRAPSWAVEGRDWPNRDASRFVTAGGIKWHVQTMGAGPVALLLHGTGAATHSWRDLAPRLAEQMTVVALDLPGHGFTSRPYDLSLPAIARGVTALLVELGVEPALVVGHSAGAAVALRLALDGAVQPRAIVGVGAALLPFPGIAARLFPAMAKLLFVNPLMPQLFALRARTPGTVGRFLQSSTGSRIDTRGVDLYARLFRAPSHVAGALGMMSSWDLTTLERDLPHLAPPLLLLHGDSDAAVPIASARTVAGQVPHGALTPLVGLGHLAHEERPDLAAGFIVDFAAAHGALAREDA